MNDKFLHQLQEEPNPEFAKNLRQELTQSSLNPKKTLNLNFQTSTFTRKAKLAWIAITLVATMSLLLTVSPVRAFVASLITDISGQLFEVTDDYPGSGNVTIIEPQILTLVEALTVFPHEVNLPTYVPSGYSLDEKFVQVYTGKDAGFLADTIEFTWISNSNRVSLIVTNRDLNSAEVVAPNSVEEISLDANHPAVVIRGGWDADKKVWTNAYGTIRLRWLAGDTTYELSGRDLQQLTESALSTLK